jgi:hypothetical protein
MRSCGGGKGWQCGRRSKRVRHYGWCWHYHRIIVALAETIRLMKEIDDVIEQHGGWPAAFHAI